MKRDSELTDAILAAIIVYMADAETVRRFVEGIAAAVASIIRIEAEQAASMLQIEADVDSLIQQWMAGITERIRGINGTTLRQIQTIVVDGLNSGRTPEQVAEEIKTLFSNIHYGRAKTIAHTEMLGAANFASWSVYGLLAVPFKRWVSMMDTRTRETHADAHWQIRGIFEPFSVGGYLFMYPGDPAAPAAEAINCRCAILPEWNPERSIWTPDHARAIWDLYLTRTAREEEVLLNAVRQQFIVQYKTISSILGVDPYGEENP